MRGLEREIAKIARKVVKEQSLDADGKKKGRSKGRKASQTFAKTTVGSDQLSHYSGVRKFSYGRAEEKDQIGIVTGLAWTQVGGELLNIEAVSMPGKGRQTKTGSLGDVMQESIQAALLRTQPCWRARIARGFSRQDRLAHSRARRRDTQGWS